MNNVTTEIRYSQTYTLGKQESTFAGGLRQSYAWFKRLGGGEGTTGSDFDLSITGNWGYDLDFTTLNVAPFMENIYKISKKFTVTPGIRLEYLRNTTNGYKEVDGNNLISNENRNRTFALAGIGLEFKPTKNTSIYTNFSQAFRPVDYAQLEPFGITSRIDKNLQDSKGFNSDLGFRGTIKNYLNFDIGGFYLGYDKRIGVTLEADPITGDYFSVRKNIANSVHKGIESYIEFNIIKYFNPNSQYGLSLFDAYSFIDAKYTTGEFKGKRVEAAAKNINRVGLVFSTNKLSATFQVNYVGDAFGDASNINVSDDPVAGYIPAYTVLDFSGSYKINNFALKFGVNNISDQQYFTRRTDEYPGPGIIPAVGRSLYLGFTAKLD